MSRSENEDYKNLGQVLEVIFPAVYLAIVAMVQCLVISKLAVDRPIVEFLNMTDLAYKFRWSFAVITAFTVWHHYVYGVFFGRWRPSILDSFVPFGLGFFQFAMISNINESDEKSFWWLGALVGICGAFAYLHCGLRVNESFFAHRLLARDAAEHCRRFRRASIRATVSLFVLSFSIAVSNVIDPKDGFWRIVCIAGPTVWMVWHLAFYEWQIKKSVSRPFEDGLLAHSRAQERKEGRKVK